ncbi:hypothetical protein BAUCODRAFT_337802 [Baudoinia panamericana UAMH 10762]|uniref:Ig-like domain-containing protein n=1 Tax=Baudoinia panamericana (strain UAMH 10762) TaxID=717646 RepID=M2NJA2_BAUPA|nr:uncharacterized protein BAUCODRAFT_337802 [Baudoinia panamericana UAMH 10762]EMC99474.1 hypothetical protein BAUCODRAFT_337802 [Baudoinia panamericana UAMH 10762]
MFTYVLLGLGLTAVVNAMPAATTPATVATVYTTTSVSYSTSTLPNSDCGPFTTVPSNYASCSPGCRPIQIPGLLAPPNSNSPYKCSDPPQLITTASTDVGTVTCTAGSTVTTMTPLWGSKWQKCTVASTSTSS